VYVFVEYANTETQSPLMASIDFFAAVSIDGGSYCIALAFSPVI